MTNACRQRTEDLNGISHTDRNSGARAPGSTCAGRTAAWSPSKDRIIDKGRPLAVVDIEDPLLGNSCFQKGLQSLKGNHMVLVTTPRGAIRAAARLRGHVGPFLGTRGRPRTAQGRPPRQMGIDAGAGARFLTPRAWPPTCTGAAPRGSRQGSRPPVTHAEKTPY